MLFALTISFLGSRFGLLLFDNLIERRLFAKSEMTKIGTAYLLAVILFVQLLPRGLFAFWVAIFLPIGMLAIVLFSLVKRRSKKLQQALTEVLTLISLKMKTGSSFRRALSDVTAESGPDLRGKLSEIAGAVVFSQQNGGFESKFHHDSFIAAYISELILIDRQPHAAIRRLSVLRQKIRIEDDFRRKSGQVLARIRAQSFVMSGLYIALSAFMVWKFGWKVNVRLYLGSFFLFVVGLIWMWRGGRNLKWKV